MKSLYARYIEEREGAGIIETEESFVTYHLYPDSIYLADMFIVPDKRNTGLHLELLAQVEEIGRKEDKKKIITSAGFGAAGLTDSVQTIINAGFSIHSGDQKLIYFVKNL